MLKRITLIALLATTTATTLSGCASSDVYPATSTPGSRQAGADRQLRHHPLHSPGQDPGR